MICNWRLLGKLAALRAGVKLEPHQVEGVERARRSKTGLILNWRTGGGKTPGTLAVAEDRGGRVLAIVPAALRDNYRQGIQKFVTSDRHADYTVAGHEEFARNPAKFMAGKPNTVVVDEIHRARNAGQLRRSLEAHRHEMPFMLGATASLLNNRPEELVPLTNLVAGKELYKSEGEFSRRHLGTEKVRAPGLLGALRLRKGGEREAAKDLERLKAKLGPHVHRYTGDPRFNSNFPGVNEATIPVELTSKQRRLMSEIDKANPDLAYKVKMNLPPSKRDLKSLNAFSVAMRQISNNPASFDAGIADKIDESPKFRAMLREQETMAKADPNFRAVVYSNFLGSGVQPVVDEATRRGLPGKTFVGGMNDKQRAQVVADYNSGKIKTLGISPAGAEGLDLKGTKLVQLTEGHWNPERSQQAIGRGVRFKSHAHLPEAERQVKVQRFVARNPSKWYHRLPGVHRDTTIDEWIDERRKEKERLNQRFLEALT